jgi:hypothetical protein
METPFESTAAKSTVSPVESPSADHYGIPTDIRQRLPSLTKMQQFRRYPYTRIDEPKERIIENFFDIRDEDDADDLQCRLAIAQIVKDTDLPREPIPQYVKDAITEVLRKPYHWRSGKSKNLIHLLQSLDLTE